jgi:hypothetical protein
MSQNRRSFWSSVPGLVTGLAGLLTGIVGLVTVLIQLGVVGGKDSGDKTTAATGTTVTTLPGATTSSTFSGGAGLTTTANVPTFTVTPVSLDFQPADAKEKSVSIKNTSTSAALTVPLPTVNGADKDRFTPAFGTCTGAPLRPGDSCTVKVTFAPNGPLRKYNASLRVAPVGANVAQEVALTATTVL